MTPKRWALRITYRHGGEAFLRHGTRIGYGPIVQFRTRRDAEINIGMIEPGLDAGTVVTVVRYDKHDE